MQNNEKVIGNFGGNSFLAKYTIEKLCKAGYRMKIGTRKPWLCQKLKNTMGSPGQVELIATNIWNEQDVKKILEGCDYSINFCGQIIEKQVTFNQLHSDWPEILSKLSNEYKIKKLIHISALNSHENHPSKYMKSKMSGEDRIKENFENYYILRPSLLYGNGDDSFFSTFGAMAQISPIIPLPLAGKTMFSPVHASDCAEAIVKLLIIENSKNRIFEITGTSNYSFKSLIQIFLKEIKKKRLLVSMPFIKILSHFLKYFPQPFTITPDQILLLQQDSIPTGKFPLLKDLGITPKEIQTVFPYWKRWRTGGEFNKDN